MLVTCVFSIPQSLTLTSMLPLAVLTQNPLMLKKKKKKLVESECNLNLNF